MTLTMAFGIDEQDIENVLQAHSLRVTNTRGLSFASMAAELLPDIDAERVAEAALEGGDELDEQTSAAYEEIHAILVEQGVIEF